MEFLAIIILSAALMWLTPYRLIPVFGALSLLISMSSICWYIGTEGIKSTITVIIVLLVFAVIWMLRLSKHGI